MDSRLTSKFVVTDRDGLQEVDSRTNLTALAMSAVGSPKPGRIVEVTVTIKTTNDPAWAACKALGSYGDSTCGTLNPLSAKCTEQHYHRPTWEERSSASPDDPDTTTIEKVCTTCEDLNVKQVSAYMRDNNGYNHPGEAKRG